MNKRLTPHERRAVARLALAGVPHRVLARAFGIDPSCVRQIRRGVWSDGSRVRGVAVPLAAEFRNVPWSRA